MDLDSLPKGDKDALAKGAMYYYTGRPCKNGHISKRLASTRQCTDCMYVYSKEYYHAGIRASDMCKKKSTIIKTARGRARKKGIKFDIKANDIIWPTHCPVLGIELDYFIRKLFKPNSPSLDRKDPKLGYVKGNCFIISFRANNLKSDGTVEELKKVLQYMENNDGHKS